jgi:hypothetical protein
MKKKLLVALAVSVMGAAGAFAQGQLLFNNLSGAASVTTSGGQYAGSQFSVGIYYQAGIVGGTTDSFIQGATFFNPGVNFFGAGGLFEANQDNGAGFFDAGATVTIPGAPAGTYTFSVVAWQGASSYAAALTTPGAYVGASSLFQINLVANPTPPNNITGLTPFTVGPAAVVPEPTTFALAGLGLASLLIFRRRK